jgi:hypothetical protein
LGEDLEGLKYGRSIQIQYETRFLINWPEHLGGGNVYVDLDGTMVLVPLLAT